MTGPCQRPECGGEVHTDGWGTPIRCPHAPEQVEHVAAGGLVPDLHGWITQQIDRIEALATAATPGPWEGVVDHHQRGEINASVWSDRLGYYITEKISSGERQEADAHHIGEHDPANVLRRCTADRKILAAHPVTRDVITVQPDGTHGFGCATCHQDEGLTIGDGWCDTLLALAEAHGWTGTNTNSKENEA